MEGGVMIPAGYMYKAVVEAPEWVHAPPKAEIYSVSGCVAEYFADYIPLWRHNGFWFFDRPEVIEELARSQSIDLFSQTLFYYEILEEQYDEDEKAWVPLPTDLPFPTNVHPPASKALAGFDVVSYSVGTSPECSPLTCNSLAAEVPVNQFCLLGSLEDARTALVEGLFRNSEPGPYRVLSVHTLPGPPHAA
jgi:hypothetical protein